MKKTHFEELYSEILFTDRYEKDKIIFWYLSQYGLREMFLDDIIDKVDGMFQINDPYSEVYKVIEIPIYNIYVVTHKTELLMDRRSGYQGNKELTLPDLETTFGFEIY
ncbi:MAG: hypothetical protein OEZ01_15575 [Candidatus Heimdallarchaeota archaeon]|nr:hypothetical protein [Candidatus Heimdallarchaeota archaeon]MDH5647429.1 hypothetical protein [Candidatus Heimdallarchaeota archaeon]